MVVLTSVGRFLKNSVEVVSPPADACRPAAFGLIAERAVTGRRSVPMIGILVCAAATVRCALEL